MASATELGVPTVAPTPGLGHRPALDALRGVAVASIVVYHTDPGWFPLAPMSLDVFFVLSTFLVTTLLLESLQHHGEPGGRRFFTRRVRRLAPALIVMLGIVVAAWAVGVFRSPELGRTAVGAAALHANVAQFGGDYFNAFAERNPLEHTWSLSVEEHFYLATFAAVALLWWATRGDFRRTRVALGCAAALTAAASVVIARHLVTVDASANRIYMGSDTRAVAAAAGVGLAAVLFGRWDAPGRVGRTVGRGAPLLLAAVVATWLIGWKPELHWYAKGGWALTALGACVIVAAAARPRSAGLVAGNPALQWAGRRSYGIYLWHLPLLVLVDELGGWALAAAFAGTCVAAELSHRLVEHRFRSGALRDRPLLLGAAALLAAIALVAVSLPEPERPSWAAVADRRSEPPLVPGDTRSGEGAAIPDPATGATAPTPAPTPPAPTPLTVWGDVTAELVAAQLAADGRFTVTTIALPECTEVAACADASPPPIAAGTAALVVAMASVDPFHPRIADDWDMEAPERTAAGMHRRLSTSAGGVPVVVAMAPGARVDLGVGLHLRRMVSDDPRNLVLDARPESWVGAIADRFLPAADSGRPTKVMLVGDSVAFSLATAFRPEGTVVWDQSRHGCDPAPGNRWTEREGRVPEPPACDWRADWARAVTTWEPDVVLWHTGTWSSYDRYLDGEHLKAGSDPWSAAIADAHAEALSILAQRGATVVVVVHAPAWETARGKPAETRPDQSAMRMPAVLAAIRAAAARTPAPVVVLDATEAVCRPDCDRPDLRDDGVHYTAEGARTVSAWIESRTADLLAR